MTVSLLGFIKGNQLWGPLLQLIAALLALYAVIWTQRKSSERIERDIQIKYDNIQEQHRLELQAKAHEIQLKKIEEIFEIVQQARAEYIELHETISTITGQSKNFEVISQVSHTLKKTAVYRMKVELLSKIYLADDALCAYWQIAGKNLIPLDSSNYTTPELIKFLTDGISQSLHYLNLILIRLSDYAHPVPKDPHSPHSSSESIEPVPAIHPLSPSNSMH